MARFPLVSIDSTCGEFSQANGDTPEAATTIATAPRPAELQPAAALAGVTPEACEQVFGMLRSTEPATACEIAHLMQRPIAVIEQAVDQLESAGRVRRWIDQTQWGQGRTLLGLPCAVGLDEPTIAEDPTAPPPAVDPRTLLATVRRRGVHEGVKRLAKLAGVAVEKMREAAQQLERLGHIKIVRPLTSALLVPVSRTW